MILFPVFRPAAITTALVFIASVVSTPTVDKGVKKYALEATAAPHFLVYSDKPISGVTPPVDQIAGYNVL